MFGTSFCSAAHVVALAGLVAVAAMGAPSTGEAQETASSMSADAAPLIELRSGFFKPVKFAFGEQEPEGVFDFFGLGFNSQFAEVMSLHPRALSQAKKAFPYNAMSLMGWAGVLAVTTKQFIDTVNKAQKVSDGQLVSDGFEIGPLIMLAASGAVAVIGGRLGKSQLNKGVELFNEGQRRNPRSVAPVTRPETSNRLLFAPIVNITNNEGRRGVQLGVSLR